jgi:hypothetical protein
MSHKGQTRPTQVFLGALLGIAAQVLLAVGVIFYILPWIGLGLAGGELPFAKPERPQGVERNIVITEWDWADPKAYLHDQISTDKHHPTVNAYEYPLRNQPSPLTVPTCVTHREVSPLLTSVLVPVSTPASHC